MINRNRKHSTHNQAVAYLQERGGGYVELVDKDATRQHYTHTPCGLDEDGDLVRPHPTDPKRGPIAAPTDGDYRIPTDEDYAELAAAAALYDAE